MVWSPAKTTTGCLRTPTISSCDSTFLTFLTLLSQYLSRSYDDKFTDVADDAGEYDFIVVGAGSAGCVVANRLSEIEEWKVLLLEAGDEEPLVADVPGLTWTLHGSSIDYGYKTQPKNVKGAPVKNRTLYYGRGKVMGGSSTINGMMYVRGSRQDYDDWVELGNAGWSYDEVLPYFKKSEDMRDLEVLRKNPDYHSTGGYLTVEGYQHTGVNSQAIKEAWKELGLEEVDYNTDNQIGTSRMQTTKIHGAKQSTNGAFIRPIRGRRSNLAIKSRARATKIIIDESSKKAIGVEYVDERTNAAKRVFASKEVIVSAGVIDSPKLLMLSGVGPARDLEEAGIPVVKDLPVGTNLHDHVAVAPILLSVKNQATAVSAMKNVQNDLAYWLSTHEGPLADFGMADNIAFLQTSQENRTGVGNIQVNFFTSLSDSQRNFYTLIPYYTGYTMFVMNVEPKSRGYLKLDPKNPVDGQPLIYVNVLDDRRDVDVLVEGALKASKIIETEAFKNNGLTAAWTPIPECDDFDQGTADWFECLALNQPITVSHAAGTCKMGPRDDPQAVVDNELRVYGIEGLRVVDAAVMPQVTRGNTNAPTIMIAEKASDLIKKDHKK
ncbi:glucose dehydrogenase-like venom protein isoform X1 [Nasonia vitripennis]|uniref:Uncharacterized protein n=1 Tax=Nasonia vitripennis TaxID=7425 RepID=A0A7M7PYS1_NASVI|nr:glucose dehydrogenase-like venom protein [Nasonia vitripennis]NP_001155086.1 glucose dehydrogenase-like venom protein [Nasonia vitripennis]XP_031777860.1 glucose dehydrogenase-like venom protein isoform X1 [Nasonia vitripennis]XP_031777861.1 glucose dehydrogenase-like venom protein isoform X1 [Nasonia vitripennis]